LQMKKNNDWTDKIRDRMDDFEAEVPDGVWEDISERIGTTEKKTIPLKRWLSAAAVAAMLAGGGWMMYDHQQTTGDIAGEVAEADGVGEKSVASSVTPNSGTYLMTDVRSKGIGISSDKDNYIPENQNIPESGNLDDDVVGTKKNDDSDNLKTHEREVNHSEQSGHLSDADNGNNARFDRRGYSNKANRLSASLYASNVSPSDFGSRNISTPVMMSAPKRRLYNDIDNSKQRVFLSDFEEKTSHSLPINIGLTLRYPLNDRWALESGVVYSRLNSTFTKVMRASEIKTEQSLHYIGIPLKVDYTMWSNRHLSAFVAAGGEADFNFKNNTSTEGIRQETDKDRPQLSATLSAGLQYNFLPRFGIFVEPGVRYYFDNGSKIDNIYKDKKLNFSFQLGVAYELGK